MKLFMENFNMTGFGCPFKTNFNYKIPNMSLSETFLPPLLFVVKYKLEANCFGLLEGKKGWKGLYGVEARGRYKK